MKTKLFFMLALAVAMLTSCGQGAANGNKGKAVATYNFSDGEVITKYQNGDKISYGCEKGNVDQVNGDIIVVRVSNIGNDNDINLKHAIYFSLVYNINLSDPIISLEDHCIIVDIYPQSGIITASKAGKLLSSPRYTIRTSDGYSYCFQSMDGNHHLFYKRWTMESFRVDDVVGKVTFTLDNGTFSFSRSDVKPEWIQPNKDIYLDLPWYFNTKNTFVEKATPYVLN